MKKLKFLFALIITFLIFNLQSAICNPVTEDTTYATHGKINSGRVVMFEFSLDSVSTSIMYSEAFDISDFYGHTIILNYQYIDETYGLAANSDTSVVKLQGFDLFGNMNEADTIGTVVSTGEVTTTALSLYKFYPYVRFKITSLVTGTHKNSYGTLKLSIFKIE